MVQKGKGGSNYNASSEVDYFASILAKYGVVRKIKNKKISRASGGDENTKQRWTSSVGGQKRERWIVFWTGENVRLEPDCVIQNAD